MKFSTKSENSTDRLAVEKEIQMIAAIRRVLGRASLGLVAMATSASGELLEFTQARGSALIRPNFGEAVLRSVEAIPSFDQDSPSLAFAGGTFRNNFSFEEDPNPLINQFGEDGVLVGLLRDSEGRAPWQTQWMLQVESQEGNVRINDVSLGPKRDLIYVAGEYEIDARLPVRPPLAVINLPQTPPGQNQPFGFVAWASLDGQWQGAFAIPDMIATSLDLDETGKIFVTGGPVLARCYDPQGREEWTVPAQGETQQLFPRHIAVEEAADERAVYVLGSINQGVVNVNQDVFVAQLSKQGDRGWLTLAEGPAFETPGGLGIGPQGNIRASLSTGNSRALTVNGKELSNVPNNPGRHAHLLLLTPDGELGRDNLLGQAVDSRSAMESHDLAIDRAGNTYVAVNFMGPFEFENFVYPGDNDAAVIAIDPAGAEIRLTSSEGPASAIPFGVAAPTRNTQVAVGLIQGKDQELFGFNPLGSLDQFNRAFFVSLDPVEEQFAVIIQPRLGQSLPQMVQQINQLGGEIYRPFNLPRGNERFVAAFVTREQRAALQDSYVITPDPILEPAGIVPSANYALETLNQVPAKAPYSYTYPETCHHTVLYLIDSAIDNSSGYFDGNSNLTIGESFLIRSTGDPVESTNFDHGTQMLSMIAGPDKGAAQGTPITVINYDIYPDGGTARLSALAEAIALANSHKSTNYAFDPSVFCIAAYSTTAVTSSPLLKARINTTIGNTVNAAVVISAGNTPGLAEDYTPSDLGSNKGVICVGASDMSNGALAGMRSGAIDLWAPGDVVPSITPAGTDTTTTGTSASAALTTGAALAYLSANPVALPDALEAELKRTAQTAAAGDIVHLSVTGIENFVNFDDWTNWYGLSEKGVMGNDDGDLWSNQEEFIWGLNPLVGETSATIASCSLDRSTSTYTYTFPLSCLLYQPATLTAPHELRDGTNLIIERSDDLDTWVDISNSITLVEEGHSDDQMTLSFDYKVSSSPCFFRVRVP